MAFSNASIYADLRILEYKEGLVTMIGFAAPYSRIDEHLWQYGVGLF
jgi:hypothetical protein